MVSSATLAAHSASISTPGAGGGAGAQACKTPVLRAERSRLQAGWRGRAGPRSRRVGRRRRTAAGAAGAPLSAAAKGGEAYTLAKLDEAERHYEQAIKALGEAFAADKDGLAPAVVELFDRNLSVVDATIQACRAAVQTEPDDLEARNYLLAAYTRKITLLDAALDLRRGDRDAAIGKTII